jgi:hypothetical protein
MSGMKIRGRRCVMKLCIIREDLEGNYACKRIKYDSYEKE